MKTTAILVWAGIGQRMGNIDKTLLELQGKHILLYSVEAFERCSLIDEIIIVVREEKIPEIQAMIETSLHPKVKKIVAGGDSRQASTYHGLVQVEDSDIVLVHDVARPLVMQEIIEEVVTWAKEFGWAIPWLPISDTIKKWNGFVDGTIDRNHLYRVQTPQGFQTSILKKSYESALSDGFIGTDEASLVERIGGKIKIVPWNSKNLKITYPEDLILAENFLNTQHPQSLEIKSYVKINLNLEIGKKLDDGYHEISSLFQAVSLFDILTISKKDVFTIEWCIICEHETNLLSKAKKLLEDSTWKNLDCSVHLIKSCPISAGLWWGSSNAASFMVGLNQIFQLWLSKETLCQIGVKVGADVPFFITNIATAQVSGIGEKIVPSDFLPMPFYVLARPHKRVSTVSVFEEYDKTGKSFYDIVSERCPMTRDMIEYFTTITKVYGMSGTGPTVFAWFQTAGEAQSAIEKYGVEKFNGDWFLVSPTKSTYEIRYV